MDSGLAARLRGFLFTPQPATPVALLRIATGSITFLWAITLLLDADPLLNWLRAGAIGEVGWWQMFPHASATVVLAMVAALVVAAGLVTIGLWTAPAAWATFFLLVAVQRYNPAAFNGGDLILRSVLVLGVALSASGSYLSLDSWKRHRRWSWAAPTVSPLGLRFVQLHVSIGYLLTVLLKLRGDAWIGGYAIWHALGLEDLARFDAPTWLAAPPVGSLLGWGTLLIEVGIGTGVWFRATRRWVLLAGVALHLGIAVFFEIVFFSFVMIASYLAFVPPVQDARMLFSWMRLGNVRLQEPGQAGTSRT